MTHPPIGLPIVTVKSEGCQWVGYDFGYTEYLGKKYRLVSPYLDGRPKHWLGLTTPIIYVTPLWRRLLDIVLRQLGQGL